MALLLSASPASIDAALAQQSLATTQRSFSIPAGPLSSALVAFGQQAGIQVSYVPSTAAGRSSPGVSGTMSVNAALTQLLAGTGLSFQMSGANTVVVSGGAGNGTTTTVDGAIALDTIDVSGGKGAVGWDGSAETVYTTPAMVSHVSAETIERYRGTSPADVLKGVPGVLSGASRTNGGIDVNIHGLQGMGRVAVTVDGATNAMTTYHGYQGVANRSYIDPDFIGGVAIEKGPSMGPTGSGAIGGNVAIRTIDANDIIPTGQNTAVRIKGEFGTNTSEPPLSGTRSGTRGLVNYLWTTNTTNSPAPPTRPIDRPNLLEPTSGAGSAVYAFRSENFDLVLGAARRQSGNYHTGTNGDGAPRPAGEICNGATGTIRTYCNLGSIPYTLGLTPYLPGQEVLNTSQDVFSTLAKATFRYEAHTLELIQTHYDSIYGETYPLGIVAPTGSTTQNLTAMMALNTYAGRYRWNPASDLLDVRLNASFTRLDESTPTDSQIAAKWSEMIATDLSNTSRFDTALGGVAVTYGTSYLYEVTAPVNFAGGGIVARDGTRSEVSAFADSRWSPVDWLQLSGGFRYHSYSAEDKSDQAGVTIKKREADAWDFAMGAAVTPVHGLQLFANYKNAARMPALFESISNTLIIIAPDLGPERASNWELGANITTRSLLADRDTLKVKLAYFDNTVDDYIYRRMVRVPYPGFPNIFQTSLDITNLAQAKFSGIEFSSQYDSGSFSLQLAATYYTNIEFCRTTATCINSSLGGDYATNHIPPRFTTSVMLSQKLLNDRLTLSGRTTYYGGRGAEAEPTASGASPFIAAIPWRSVLLLDAYAEYKLNESAKLTLSAENITDQYYVDPLSIALIPSPGRTIKAGFTATLGGKTDGLWGDLAGSGVRNWSGVYVGGHLSRIAAHSRITDIMSHQMQYLPGRDPIVYSPSGPTNREGVDDTVTAGGGRIGYNYQTGSLVLGAELEGSWGDIVTSGTSARGVTSYDVLASANFKAGIAFGDALVYGKAGLGIAPFDMRFDPQGQELDGSGISLGLATGVGLEYALTDSLSLFGEYQHMRLKSPGMSGFSDTRSSDGIGLTHDVTWKERATMDLLKVGMNVRF